MQTDEQTVKRKKRASKGKKAWQNNVLTLHRRRHYCYYYYYIRDRIVCIMHRPCQAFRMKKSERYEKIYSYTRYLLNYVQNTLLITITIAILDECCCTHNCVFKKKCCLVLKFNVFMHSVFPLRGWDFFMWNLASQSILKYLKFFSTLSWPPQDPKEVHLKSIRNYDSWRCKTQKKTSNCHHQIRFSNYQRILFWAKYNI